MKKLLIWDCDETLWVGTVVDGDDVFITPKNLSIVKELHERGVVQSIASRNNLEDVRSRISEFGISDMFLSPQADFERPKSQMVQQVKDDLGLARFEDIVFVDDQEFNLQEVRQNCPGLVCIKPEMLEDALDTHFHKDQYTDDDRKRVQRYRSELERKKGASSYGGDYIGFLGTCGMKMEVFCPDAKEMVRFIDLVARANRMSAIDGEISASSLWDIYNRSPSSLLAIRVKDNFGDYGVCGVAVLHSEGETDCFVRALVISCRMQGKGIGSAFLGTIINKNIGKMVHGIWVETKYNQGMRNLYSWYKFNESQFGHKVHFSSQIDAEVSLPPWIEVTERK
jgi:FkbH-like protein